MRLSAGSGLEEAGTVMFTSVFPMNTHDCRHKALRTELPTTQATVTETSIRPSNLTGPGKEGPASAGHMLKAS